MAQWSRLVKAMVIGVAVAAFGGVALATPAAADPGTDVVGGTRAAQGEFPWMVRLSMGAEARSTPRRLCSPRPTA